MTRAQWQGKSSSLNIITITTTIITITIFSRQYSGSFRGPITITITTTTTTTTIITGITGITMAGSLAIGQGGRFDRRQRSLLPDGASAGSNTG
jgi:hypothetical protein